MIPLVISLWKQPCNDSYSKDEEQQQETNDTCAATSTTARSTAVSSTSNHRSAHWSWTRPHQWPSSSSPHENRHFFIVLALFISNELLSPNTLWFESRTIRSEIGDRDYLLSNFPISMAYFRIWVTASPIEVKSFAEPMIKKSPACDRTTNPSFPLTMTS